MKSCKIIAVPVVAGTVVVFFLAVAAAPAADGRLAGAATCGECHRDIYQRQSESRHAQALRPINESPLPPLLMERPLRERSGLSYEYEVVGERLAVTVQKSGGRFASLLEDRATALLEWTFGAGSQGLTPVGTVDGRFFEHRVSYYPQRGVPAITQGHPLQGIASARDALGVIQRPDTAFQCFSCHATGVRKRKDKGPDLSEMRPGVECERCHGPGQAHIVAARSNGPGIAVAIQNPGRGTAREIVEKCAGCHRMPKPGQDSRSPERDDPFSVRFQPIGLMASQCFLRSGKLDCVSCHDPHEDARTDSTFYVAKCLECHSEPASADHDCGRTAQENCLPCHMRKAAPEPYLVFTDHRIRVY